MDRSLDVASCIQNPNLAGAKARAAFVKKTGSTPGASKLLAYG
jgi:hypothetical protein